MIRRQGSLAGKLAIAWVAQVTVRRQGRSDLVAGEATLRCRLPACSVDKWLLEVVGRQQSRCVTSTSKLKVATVEAAEALCPRHEVRAQPTSVLETCCSLSYDQSGLKVLGNSACRAVSWRKAQSTAVASRSKGCCRHARLSGASSEVARHPRRLSRAMSPVSCVEKARAIRCLACGDDWPGARESRRVRTGRRRRPGALCRVSCRSVSRDLYAHTLERSAVER